MVQTLLWSRMTCSSKIFKYPSAVLAETPATYILVYCNACIFSAFTAIHCFQFKKKVLELNATLGQSSDRTVQHLCLWLQNEHGRQFCEEFARRPGGTNNKESHACEPILIIKKTTTETLKEGVTTIFRVVYLYTDSIFCGNFIFLLSYNSVQRHEHHCRSFPLCEVRIPRRTAARAHFVVINKGARQFHLNSATR